MLGRMELFFPLDGNGDALALMCFGALFAFIFAILALVMFSAAPGYTKPTHFRVAGSLSVVMALGGVAAMVVGHNLSQEVSASFDTIRENREAFFTDRGVYVPESQWENLEFPAYEPTEDARFGIAQAELDGKIVDVRLAWENGEMVLYRTEGVLLEVLD